MQHLWYVTGMAGMTRRVIPMDEGMWDALGRLAEREERSRAWLVRRAVGNLLASEKLMIVMPPSQEERDAERLAMAEGRAKARAVEAGEVAAMDSGDVSPAAGLRDEGVLPPAGTAVAMAEEFLEKIGAPVPGRLKEELEQRVAAKTADRAKCNHRWDRVRDGSPALTCKLCGERKLG